MRWGGQQSVNQVEPRRSQRTPPRHPTSVLELPLILFEPFARLQALGLLRQGLAIAGEPQHGCRRIANGPAFCVALACAHLRRDILAAHRVAQTGWMDT